MGAREQPGDPLASIPVTSCLATAQFNRPLTECALYEPPLISTGYGDAGRYGMPLTPRPTFGILLSTNPKNAKTPCVAYIFVRKVLPQSGKQ